MSDEENANKWITDLAKDYLKDGLISERTKETIDRLVQEGTDKSIERAEMILNNAYKDYEKKQEEMHTGMKEMFKEKEEGEEAPSEELTEDELMQKFKEKLEGIIDKKVSAGVKKIEQMPTRPSGEGKTEASTGDKPVSKKKFCRFCGNELSGTEKFCRKCGKEL